MATTTTYRDTVGRTGPWPNRIAWALQILLALVFLASGGAKLIALDPMIDLFAQIGVGQWFRVVTGLIEVSAALCLLKRSTAWIGAVLIVCTMTGATVTHLFIVPSSPVAAIVLGTLAAIVLWLRRPSRAT